MTSPPRNADNMRALYHRRKEAGLCTRCGGERGWERPLVCARCREGTSGPRPVGSRPLGRTADTPRAITLSVGRASKREVAHLRELNALMYPRGIKRPCTRGDCENDQRPCPFISCKYHLYLDVDPVTGSLKLNFPHLEPWELTESCALDVADRGGATLDEVASALNVVRERSRQIEEKAIRKLKRYGAELRECL